MTIDRQKVFSKFKGKCAYSGTLLEPDWQVDHIIPADPYGVKDDSIDNLFPAQKLINHYKRGLPLELFRTWRMGKLHEKIAALPKNPRCEKSIKRKKYMLKVASYFNIDKDNKFNGKFYFELN